MVYLVYFLCCYVLGWFMTGYLVVRFLTKTDIRKQGSGNIGAMNSGRAAGTKGFILTFIGDALKGVIAVMPAVMFDFPGWIILLGLTFVVMGHIYPLPLGFHGGKGVSAFLGGMISYDPYSILFIACTAGIAYIWQRNFTIAGLFGISLSPVYFLIIRQITEIETLILLGLVLLIVWAHRLNIDQFVQKYKKAGEVK